MADKRYDWQSKQSLHAKTKKSFQSHPLPPSLLSLPLPLLFATLFFFFSLYFLFFPPLKSFPLEGYLRLTFRNTLARKENFYASMSRDGSRHARSTRFSPFSYIYIYIYIYIFFFHFFFQFFFFLRFFLSTYIFHIEQYPQSRLVNEQYFRDPVISKKSKGEQRLYVCVCVCEYLRVCVRVCECFYVCVK